jgi:hypothetical protein
MQLDISVFMDERYKCTDVDDPDWKGYLRPSMAMTDFPDRPATSAVLQTIFWDMAYPGGARATPIELSQGVSDAICTFYNQYRGQKLGLDCYGLINLVAQKPLHNLNFFNDHWIWSEITEEQIVPGNIVILSSFLRKFKHAAVCIAPDLFISVYGVNGEIEFGTFADIHESYRTDWIDLATPL